MRLVIEIDDLEFINRWKEGKFEPYNIQTRFYLPGDKDPESLSDSGNLYPGVKRHEELARLEELSALIRRAVEEFYNPR